MVGCLSFLLQREWRIGTEVCTAAAGGKRSFFVDANGALLACGKQERDEVGLRGGTSQTPFTVAVPTPVPSMAGVRIRAVACSDCRNLAVSEAGQLFAWGRQLQPMLEENIAGRECEWQAPVPTVMEELRNHRVRQVVAGEWHSAALTEDGALFTWETQREEDAEPGDPVPELGHGLFFHGFGVPRRVRVFAGVRIASVAAGCGFTVAVTEAGAVFSFGMADGRLGHGRDDEEEHVYFPKRIEALDGIHVAIVAVGVSHALALTRCGRVYSWGAQGGESPVHGLGNDSDGSSDGDERIDCDYFIPRVIKSLLGNRVRAIAAGEHMSCAVTEAGALYTWGENGYGNLGHGQTRHQNKP
jgi:alpha-tubulin suppressor-like RCC1 family protein